MARGSRGRRWSSRFAIVVAALCLGSCDGDSPTGPVVVVATSTPALTPTPTPTSSGGGTSDAPKASFAVLPLPGADGKILGSTPFDVTFNMCATVNPDPVNRELYFALDFLGDGSATHSGTTGSDCRFTYRYGTPVDAFARVCVVDRDRLTHKELHEFQCTTFHVVVVGGFCHAISSANATRAVACPSGATVYCDASPIVATSSAQAKGACEACYGVGQCTASPFDWEGPGAAYIYGDPSLFVCNPGDPIGPGDITPYDCNLATGRWAP
jgi:hypothetical protein